MKLIKINYFFLSKIFKNAKKEIESYIMLINSLSIFVAIQFLILPIDILCEKVPKYTLLNHAQRKLEENDNYIIIIYRIKITYEANEFTKIESKKQIQYILYEGKELDLSRKFIIDANTTIKIFFSEPIKSLNSFFSANLDLKVLSIKLIDLSHFDSSLLENTEYLFAGCYLLEEINFDNFKTSKVTTMSQMLQGCAYLKTLN